MPSLTRREFVVGTVGLAMWRPWTRWGGEPRDRFVFFSDTHVGLRANIAENWAMLAEIASLGPAFAINGGDVTDYGWAEEYANYRRLIDPLDFPVHHVPGNHDVRWSPLGPKAYREGTSDSTYTSFDFGRLHIVLLDSTIPLSHWGHFESEMLRWLARDLQACGRERPVVLVTHHWVGRDKVMVDNEEALFRVIEPYNVKLILNGHGHSDLVWTWNGLANTMNRGLYQGSFEVLQIDPAEDALRLARRTKERPSPEPLMSVPLRPDREKRPVWQVAPKLRAGSEVGIPPGPYREARWGDGPWTAIEGGIATKGLVLGTYALALRSDAQTYVSAGTTQVAAESGALRKAWERSLPGGVMSHLAEAAGLLFVSQMDGSVQALRARDGEVVWTAKMGGYGHSSPVVVDDLVVVGSADGNVYAFDRFDGKRIWRAATGGPVYASAAVAKEICAIASGDGSVYGLDVRSGRRRWRYDLPAGNTAFCQSPAATDGERFFLGAWDKHVYALDAETGKLIWRENAVGERSFAYSPAIGGPCLGEGAVFVPANGNLLWAYDAERGTVRWSTASPGDKFGYSSPAYRDGRVFVGCLGDRGEVRAVDAATGAIRWTCATGSVIYDSGPALGDDFLAIGSVSGLLNIIGLDDGRLRAQYRLPVGHFLSTPVARGRRVFVATYADTCAAFDVV